jgi:outer membrane protein OmpA-like peptidoglycan-associated protein
MRCSNDVVIEVQGHSDAIQTDSYNRNITLDRAQAVVRYLVEAGVSPERLRAKGYGASRPLVPNDIPEARLKNRRIQFVVSARAEQSKN